MIIYFLSNPNVLQSISEINKSYVDLTNTKKNYLVNYIKYESKNDKNLGKTKNMKKTKTHF